MEKNYPVSESEPLSVDGVGCAAYGLGEQSERGVDEWTWVIPYLEDNPR